MSRSLLGFVFPSLVYLFVLGLVDFLRLFPQYVGREFYITGESYGGIYVPTLMVRVMKDNRFNLKVNSMDQREEMLYRESLRLIFSLKLKSKRELTIQE